MAKYLKRIEKLKYDDPIRCPNCKRILGNVTEFMGKAKMTYICPRCGDIELDIKE